jgi:DNA-directed RNA polymerase subunit beta'
MIYYRYEGAFEFGSGVEALQRMLKELDVKKEIENLIQQLKHTNGKKREDLFKRLRIFVAFYTSGVKPESTILEYLPVIPADLRPIVQLDGGKFASSDINVFYRRVLMRNIRLKKMIDAGMPEVVKRNEIRLLQEAVNNLILGERNQSGKTGSGVKVYKSLTDILIGKEGRFRKNLLGKRVDYSGRSVITV